MADITSKPYRPAMCCEACVFGRGPHTECLDDPVTMYAWATFHLSGLAIPVVYGTFDRDSQPGIKPNDTNGGWHNG